jgi:hypothetical protein
MIWGDQGEMSTSESVENAVGFVDILLVVEIPLDRDRRVYDL